MSSSLCLWTKGSVRTRAFQLGAVAFGCSRAQPVDPEYRREYKSWLAEGKNGSMAYLERYTEQRFDPRLLLPGASTVISLAFSYRPAGGCHHPYIADYALGKDYHIVVRQRLEQLAAFLREEYGAISRPCVDTAPIPERYWAQRSGIGWIGLNGQLIVPEVGSGIFLGELITTLALEPDEPIEGDCGRCGKCIKVCPGHCINRDEAFDARKCLSYLTIEHRGELPADIHLSNHIYGCDECQRVCPHNAGEPPEALAEFAPDPRLFCLDKTTATNITSGEWKRLTATSAMNRISLKQLKRNIDKS